MSTDTTANTPTRGMLLGKFMPPHAGHRHLFEFAYDFCINQAPGSTLDIVVCSLPTEPIPGDLRAGWVREIAPLARVWHLTELLPQAPEESPTFWPQWDDALRRLLPDVPTAVFASEPYGQPLADLFGARFIPVDLDRERFPISGTMVRADPMACWPYIPREVRPYFVRRICVFGPESAGKSTLTAQLASALGTRAVPEYARAYLEALGRDPVYEDMLTIGQGQAALEDVLARDAERVLCCDTDTLTTTIWSEVLFGRVDPALMALAELRLSRYTLHLLLDVDLPWVRDDVRYLPDERRSFFDRCEAALQHHNLTYRVVTGQGPERLRCALAHVRDVLDLDLPSTS